MPDQTSRSAHSRRVTRLRISGLRSGWLIIPLCALLGVLAGGWQIHRTPKAYVASAQVFVTVSAVSDASQLYSGDQFTQSRVQSYISLVDSPDITTPVREQLHLNYSDRTLAGMISADAPLNKVLINIHARNGSAELAAKIANATAQQFIIAVQHVETLENTGKKAAAASPLKLTVVHPASTPAAPVAPQKTLTLLVGLLGGLVLGMLLLVVRERLFRRVRGSHDLEAVVGTPPLALVPNDRRSGRQPNAFRADNRARAEAYRQLRTNLQFVDLDSPPRVVAVSGPTGSEGATSVALNLAVALAEAGTSVVLIEANLRQPALARLFDLKDDVGLTTLLIEPTDVKDVVQDVGGGLSVVTSGPVPFNPSELLASRRTRAAMLSISERFEFTVIDAAPLLPIADGAETAAMAEMTIVVARSGRTKPDDLSRAISTVRRVGGTVAGAVLNRVSVASGWSTPPPARQIDVERQRLVEEGARTAKNGDRPVAAGSRHQS